MKKILITLSLVLFILTPYFNHLATLERGYKAYGGECIIFILPLLCLGFLDKKEKGNDNC